MAKDKKVTQSKQPAEKVTPVKKRGPRLKPTLFHAVAGKAEQRPSEAGILTLPQDL